MSIRKYWFLCTILVLIYVDISIAFDLNEGWLMRVNTRENGNTSIIQGTRLNAIKSAFLTESMRSPFRNAPYIYTFYDSLSTPVNGNFNLADSVLYIVDFRTKTSGFYCIHPGLWNALNAVINDSVYANVQTIFLPDSIDQTKVCAIAFHYKGFIEADMKNFTDRVGFGKYHLHFPQNINETNLRKELQNFGVQFAQ